MQLSPQTIKQAMEILPIWKACIILTPEYNVHIKKEKNKWKKPEKAELKIECIDDPYISDVIDISIVEDITQWKNLYRVVDEYVYYIKRDKTVLRIHKTEIASLFEQYGWSFVKKLWESLYHADPINTKKLLEAFQEYTIEYIEQFYMPL